MRLARAGRRSRRWAEVVIAGGLHIVDDHPEEVALQIDALPSAGRSAGPVGAREHEVDAGGMERMHDEKRGAPDRPPCDCRHVPTVGRGRASDPRSAAAKVPEMKTPSSTRDDEMAVGGSASVVPSTLPVKRAL